MPLCKLHRLCPKSAVGTTRGCRALLTRARTDVTISGARRKLGGAAQAPLGRRAAGGRGAEPVHLASSQCAPALLYKRHWEDARLEDGAKTCWHRHDKFGEAAQAPLRRRAAGKRGAVQVHVASAQGGPALSYKHTIGETRQARQSAGRGNEDKNKIPAAIHVHLPDGPMSVYNKNSYVPMKGVISLDTDEQPGTTRRCC